MQLCQPNCIEDKNNHEGREREKKKGGSWIQVRLGGSEGITVAFADPEMRLSWVWQWK